MKGGSGATVSAGRRRRGLSDALVVGEAAVSVALLIAAGLLLRSFVKLETLHFGARERGVLTAQVELPATRYKTTQETAAFGQGWLQKVRALPGVESAAITSRLPLEGGENGTITLFGQPTNRNNSESAWVEMHGITPGYFRTFAIPLIAGRELDAEDAANAVRVDGVEAAWMENGIDPSGPKYWTQTEGLVVACDINETMARMFWPGKNPIGQKFSYWGTHGPWWQVVGIVGNTRQWGLENAPRPEEFQPWDNALGSGTILVLHAAVSPQTLVGSVRQALKEVDPDLVLYDALTMQQVVSRLTVSQQFMSWLIGIFALLALALAASGIYGVMSYLVTQRTREIGIRMALGADRRTVLRNVVGHGMKLTAGGILIGLVGAAAGGRVLESFLFEVNAMDWGSFVTAAAILGVAAMLACWVPGRRAAGVEPVVALRQD